MKKTEVISMRVTAKDKAFIVKHGLNPYELLKRAIKLERMRLAREKKGGENLPENKGDND